MAIREVRRTDAPLQEAHGGEALQMCGVREVLRAVRPPGPPHEETPAEDVEIMTREPVGYQKNEKFSQRGCSTQTFTTFLSCPASADLSIP